MKTFEALLGILFVGMTFYFIIIPYLHDKYVKLDSELFDLFEITTLDDITLLKCISKHSEVDDGDYVSINAIISPLPKKVSMLYPYIIAKDNKVWHVRRGTLEYRAIKRGIKLANKGKTHEYKLSRVTNGNTYNATIEVYSLKQAISMLHNHIKRQSKSS